jgi:hypothetical protein
MIVVQAQVWPGGQQLQSYEALSVVINNTSSPGMEKESYMAHVLARPKLDFGIVGYEADVEVPAHDYHHGLAPLLMSILVGAHTDDPDEPMFIPPCNTLTRVVLREMQEFEARIRQ